MPLCLSSLCRRASRRSSFQVRRLATKQRDHLIPVEPLFCSPKQAKQKQRQPQQQWPPTLSQADLISASVVLGTASEKCGRQAARSLQLSAASSRATKKRPDRKRRKRGRAYLAFARAIKVGRTRVARNAAHAGYLSGSHANQSNEWAAT